MINQKKTANAIGGKTARACDSCLKRRATWFCASDDAFLCGACDSLVHSANDDDDDPSSRHKRVCLDTNPSANNKPPSWHHGFTKKARTPRNNNKAKATIFKYYSSSSSSSQTMPVVPDQFGSEEHSNHESEEDQMVFSVPNLDDYHFHQNTTEREKFVKGLGQLVEEEDMDMISVIGDDTEFNISLISGFDEWDVNYLPVGLFAAEDAAVMKGQEDKEEGLNNNKVEEEGDIIISTTTTNNDHCCYIDWSIDDMFTTTTTNNNNNACWGHEQSQASCVQDNNKVVVPIKEEDELHTPTMQADSNNNNNKKERSRILLRLNYEGVISAWATQTRSTSPWINGHRPEYLLHHHAWPNCMDNFGQGDVRPTRTVRQGEEWMGYREHVNGGDGGRRARVTRYREKRRTRLFSKKIRYEVRKLNAEKRPRLKGRFVKRTSLSQVVVGKDHVGVAPSYPYLNG